MTLADTGPLVALINGNDDSHTTCNQALATLRDPLLTTWPCLTESMYLLGKSIGYKAQEELWGYVADGLLVLLPTSQQELERMRILMAQYQDAPMDLADASLVAAAETLALRRVFTLDSHFYAYRTADEKSFEVVP